MDLVMAIDARKSREMNLAVTFHTKAPGVSADQKESVRRSMGRMATAAAFKLL
jgi:hypothetical protein